MHDVQVYREKRGLGFPESAKLVRRAVKAALRAQGIAKDCTVSVLLTDDAGIRAINLAQRGIDAPTDVLSFPLNELTEGAFDAAACDMEGGAIAQCCYEMQVPYAACRAISDTRTGDGREYSEKALYACEQEQKMMLFFLPLYQKEVCCHG